MSKKAKRNAKFARKKIQKVNNNLSSTLVKLEEDGATTDERRAARERARQQIFHINRQAFSPRGNDGQLLQPIRASEIEQAEDRVVEKNNPTKKDVARMHHLRGAGKRRGVVDL